MAEQKEIGKDAADNDKESRLSAPTISLPKGGGAIRGIGEKFSANPVTGTGSMTVPISTSPGRSGFGPQLNLSYDSGSGNGPFGFGWSLSLPAITRKTDKGLPQYRDDFESDIFILSGSEDLVPVLAADGTPETLPQRVLGGITYDIRRYRPRIEGLFARIERWTVAATGEAHWRSITRDNITTLYGRTGNSRIADPVDPNCIFSWLICESFDDKGNAVVYEYKAEDSTGVDDSQAHEANRTAASRSANRYVKFIRYGNRVSRLVAPDLAQADWIFEVVFDYGEHDAAAPKPGDAGPWLYRHDPFSSYRAGFEVRTYRLCQRVLMFHHFAVEPDVGVDCLVRSTDFAYRSVRSNPADLKQGDPVASFIASMTQTGYRRTANGYLSRSMPPLEFTYSDVEIQEDVQELDADSVANLPAGLSGGYQWVDLDGEGVSGVLTEQAGGWFYKPGLGAGRFGAIEMVAAKPSLAALAGGRQLLLDVAGDGQLDLVAYGGPTPGFYERTEDADWSPFRAFRQRPDIQWDDPNLRFVDLDGDGHADVLVTEDDELKWYASLAQDGFGPAQRVAKPTGDEESGPRLLFADGTESVYVADMSGDGLSDLVRIRNGEVCYWPNRGYGQFGAKVAMDNAPWFDVPELFDQKRVRLADIDGSGTTDIIYLAPDGIHLYFNQSGNSWSDARILSQFPAITHLSAVAAADLLGNGTACLVWSSPLPGDSRQPVRYIDLMGGQKPHLLVSAVNNLGAETHISYAPSTKFYLKDKEEGRPWATRLPFPVHVVERVESYDYVARNRFVTRYAYHHGYFDGIEREFRGFGMVEQWDTEEIGAAESGDFPTGENFDDSSYVPPVWTKTWFHNGAFAAGPRVSKIFEHEYYREPGLTDDQAEALLVPDTLLPDGLTPEEQREACRALKGLLLRQEVYALDPSPRAALPYSVSERNYDLLAMQPLGPNRHAVFYPCPRETVDYHYDRQLYPVGNQMLPDPRVSHSLTLAVDQFGNVLQSAAVAYGRRHDDPDPLLTNEDKDRQRTAQIAFTENRYTNAVSGDDAYRVPMQCESQTFELLLPANQVAGQPVTKLFRLDDLKTTWIPSASDGNHDLLYENFAGVRPNPGEAYRRPIEQTRTLYRRDDLAGAVALGVLQPLALPFENYKLALTPSLIAAVYGNPVTDAMLTAAGYVHTENDANWWIPSGRVFYRQEISADPPTPAQAAAELAEARAHFFLPRRFRDPFRQDTLVSYHAPHDLLVLETIDALQNRVTAGTRKPDDSFDTHGLDYRVLQAKLTTDANGNRSAAAFDALGLVVGIALVGKAEENLGDSLANFDADLDEATVQAHMADPLADPHAILKQATRRLLYDLHAFQRTKGDPQPQAVVAYTIARETHEADLAQGEKTKVQHAFSYSDGFGREIQKKAQAEPGPLVEGGPLVDPRWVGSGWVVFNNKGDPVRKYEPFFDNTHGFKFANKVGVSAIQFYDPLGRAVAKSLPNYTYEKVVIDPWRQTKFDVNDTVLADPKNDPDAGTFFKRLPDADYLPTWYARRQGGGLGPEEQSAADKAAVHADTPTTTVMDTLGRSFLTIAHNRFGKNGAPVNENYLTRTLLDIEGNTRAVTDALGRTVVRYDFDMLRGRLHEASMEAGERRTLNDVIGKPVYRWDSRGHVFRNVYDALRRPTDVFLKDGNNAEILVQRTEYGEGEPNARGKNLRGRVVRVRDGAGVVVSDDYDFKGNLRHSTRQLAKEYKNALDWNLAVPLEVDLYETRTTFDALNRALTMSLADTSVIRSTFNEANLLERVDVNLQGSAAATAFVTNIDYNARGQRELIELGNGVRTEYRYDEKTFRLTDIFTSRGAAFPADGLDRTNPPSGVQNLHYTYDPAGNVTHLRDSAQQTVFFRNSRVEPVWDYRYDAIYQLIAASGREHLGQAADGTRLPPAPMSPTDAPRVGLQHPGDRAAVGIYLQQYLYDAVGNITQMAHAGTDPVNPGWTRAYHYAEASQLEPARMSNRLSDTQLNADPPQPYTYDADGNMTTMPHLPLMVWDYADRLAATSKQILNNGGTPETTYYVYDASGQRVRKVTEGAADLGANPKRKSERIYLGGVELYREYGGNGAVALERRTLHVMDDKQRVALVETRTQGNEPGVPRQLIRYQFGNHLGSAALELDDHAQIISYEEYYPYGSTSYQAVRSQTETPKRYRYTGKERDEETGLYYHGARYYAPWLGRWTACDPSGIADGLNLYRYVRNNSLRLIDQVGRGGEDPNDPPKGGHDKNARPSTKEDHETADSRRKREQEKRQEKEREQQREKQRRNPDKETDTERKQRENREKKERMKKENEEEKKERQRDPENERKEQERRQREERNRQKEREQKERQEKERQEKEREEKEREEKEREEKEREEKEREEKERQKNERRPPPVVDRSPVEQPSGWKVPAFIIGGAVVVIVAGAATIALAADDATGIGVADDVAIPATGGATLWGANLVRVGVAAALAY
jgi:RHS repeat-associated protein